MRLSPVVPDTAALVVSILLPATKSDPGALSCTRSWGCVCTDPDKADAFTCPYHAAVAQKASAHAKFKHKIYEEGFQFHPCWTGAW